MQEPARSTGSAQVIPGRSPGRADDFDYAASMARPLPWTLEETILAGWAAARNEWRGVNMTSRVVQDLSQILRGLPIHPIASRPADFRSPGSIGRKINSLRSARPDYEGKGLRVTELEAAVTGRFLEDEAAMMAEARRILDRYGVPEAS